MLASEAHRGTPTVACLARSWLQVHEKRLACLSDFNLGNGSSALNSVRGPQSSSSLSSSSLSPDKAALAALAGGSGTAALRLPRIVSTETVLATRCRRVYANAHTYHINSIALSSDQESFVSADDLRINLWHLDRPDAAFNVVDIKPTRCVQAGWGSHWLGPARQSAAA